ncbi:MAG TPA: glycosyltransferase, partial [Methanobacterium sp.]|nr:glycosyltransferase [Methanobacterium sp.]
SVICVYNDEESLNEYLLNSLNNQSVEYELILLDNRNGKYKSAPEALNQGGSKAKGDYLMFVHQDVDLKSSNWLIEAEDILINLDNWGIAGVAGVPENGVLKSNIENGVPPNKPGQKINKPSPVQTLDECLIFIPKTIFNKFKFDEKLVGWHLYSVDYCLNIKKYGFEVFVLPLYIYHRSYMIHYVKEYYDMLKIVLRKYREDYVKINTSCGVWKTNYPLYWYKFLNTKPGFFIRTLMDTIKR